MKPFLFLFLIWAVCSPVFGQAIVGSYEQTVLEAPAQYRSGEEVTISRDPKSAKKIWVSGLIPNQRFYALLYVSNEDGATYTVPKQRVGNYQINVGCIVYDDDDSKVVISLNNKGDCDDNVSVSVSKEGVSTSAAGGVRVGSDGRVSAPGAEVGPGSVKVDTRAATGAGITYIGKKR